MTRASPSNPGQPIRALPSTPSDQVRTSRDELVSLRAETRAAIAAAGVAGAILDRWFGRVGPGRLKSAPAPGTRAAGRSERAIRRLLGRRFPTIGFLGEEGGTVA